VDLVAFDLTSLDWVGLTLNWSDGAMQDQWISGLVDGRGFQGEITRQPVNLTCYQVLNPSGYPSGSRQVPVSEPSVPGLTARVTRLRAYASALVREAKRAGADAAEKTRVQCLSSMKALPFRITH